MSSLSFLICKAEVRTGIAGHICKFLYNSMILKKKRQETVASSNMLYEVYITSDDNTIMNL